MSNNNQARIKILTRVTVDSALTLKIYASVAAQYDTSFTCDLPAGNYYMADDHQSDDLIYVLANAAMTASLAAGLTSGPFFWIDSDHKVNIQFIGSSFSDPGGAAHQNDVKIAWTEEDGADIAALLGFDPTADLAKTDEDHATFTAGYYHPYGWYADEDGLLEGDEVEDSVTTTASQGRSIAGNVKTLYKGDNYDNHFDLTHLPESKTHSAGVGYEEASVYPYERNEALECWYHSAKTGVPFRIYRHNQKDLSLANARGTASGGAVATLTDSSKSWDEDPQRWAGALLVLPPLYYVVYYNGVHSFYISSNTDDDITIANKHPIDHAIAASDVYYLFDMRYKTYILKSSGQGFAWAPTEIDKIKKWMYKIEVMRYVAT